MPLNYNYDKSKQCCEQIGLKWLGDDYHGLIVSDAMAKQVGMTQEQVDQTMYLHLWEVRQLFTPQNYKFLQRLMIAFYFLSGWKPK